MEEITQNSPQSDKPWLFKKGQSGNPGGRPKNTLKAFVQQMFQEMSDEEKREWLREHKVQAIDIWKMGEGLPKQDIDVTADVVSKVIKLDE